MHVNIDFVCQGFAFSICTKCIWYSHFVCMSVFCNSNFSKDTENEERVSVVQRQYENKLNFKVLNKRFFTIYGILICWRIADFPEDILLTMDLLIITVLVKKGGETHVNTSRKLARSVGSRSIRASRVLAFAKFTKRTQRIHTYVHYMWLKFTLARPVHEPCGSWAKQSWDFPAHDPRVKRREAPPHLLSSYQTSCNGVQLRYGAQWSSTAALMIFIARQAHYFNFITTAWFHPPGYVVWIISAKTRDGMGQSRD